MHIIRQYFPNIRECVHDFGINVESIQLSTSDDLLYTHAITEQKKLLLELLLSVTKEEIEKNTKALVQLTIEYEISYLFLYSELVTVARKLLGSLVEKKDFENITAINRYFAEHEDRITSLYLQKFLKQLALKNELRLSHISIMPDKKFMVHYEPGYSTSFSTYSKPNTTTHTRSLIPVIANSVNGCMTRQARICCRHPI